MGIGDIYILSNRPVEGAKLLPVIKQIYLPKKIDLKKYDYLIFTSKNGVLALNSFCNEWQKLPSLAIGKATAKMIEKLGGRVVYRASNFYGDAFSQEIVEHFDQKSRFLYLRAKKVLSNLSSLLRESGFMLDEEIVYETLCAKKQSPPPPKSTLIFSSPSTIECFFKLYRWDESYSAVVIGKKTASFMPSSISYTLFSNKTLQEIVDVLKREG